MTARGRDGRIAQLSAVVNWYHSSLPRRQSGFDSRLRDVNVEDLAYIAGFFDGEGCAYINYPKAHKNGKRYPRLNAKVAQNDRDVLDWIQGLLGCGNVHKKRTADCYDLVFTYKSARIFLTAIEPYLRVKKANVTALLDITGREDLP